MSLSGAIILCRRLQKDSLNSFELNIHLKYFEEAFTSEHWIVRIYRVKKEQPTNPSVSYLTKQEKSLMIVFVGSSA